MAISAGLIAQSLPPDECARLIVGTGHASGFFFAHDAVSRGRSSPGINSEIGSYGQPDGRPSEDLSTPDVPFYGGELGPAVSVATAISAGVQRRVVCVIGDGEMETPAALAGIVHARQVLDRWPSARFLPVVNANGARMGGTSAFGPASVRAVLESGGFEVVILDLTGCSLIDLDSVELASDLDEHRGGRRLALVVVSEKGFGAPETLGGQEFSGHRSHKPPGQLSEAALRVEVPEWAATYDVGSLLDDQDRFHPDLVRFAGRLSMRLVAADRTSLVGSTRLSERASNGSTETSVEGVRSPMAVIDDRLAKAESVVFSPDEASSNRLQHCLDVGLVVEVLSEQTCFGWAWGAVETGQRAAVVTYEAFAPLFSSMIAQYSKLLCARPQRGLPSLVVVLTSLGWGNAPTHSNCDLLATSLARRNERVHSHFPSTAYAANRTMSDVFMSRDSIEVVWASKQPLYDGRIPNIGYSADAIVSTIGDVCFHETVAAANFCETLGVSLEVRPIERFGSQRVVESSPPDFVVTPFQSEFFASALREQFGESVATVGAPTATSQATPWETLRRRGVDRTSIVEVLMPRLQSISEARFLEWRSELDELNRKSPWPSAPGVRVGVR